MLHIHSLLLCVLRIAVERVAAESPHGDEYVEEAPSELVLKCPEDHVPCKGNNLKAILCKAVTHGAFLIVCRPRCPLGFPELAEEEHRRARCAAECAGGFHLVKPELGSNRQTCRRHTVGCPSGERVILPGNTWHDTICGRPEDYRPPRGYYERIESPPFRETLGRLTLSWVPAIHSANVRRLCASLSGAGESDECIFDLGKWVARFPRPEETLYSALREIRADADAQLMFTSVVAPFLHGDADLYPALDVRLSRRTQVALGERRTLTINAALTVPLKGLTHGYALDAVYWYTRDPRGSKLVLVAAGNKTTSVLDRTRYTCATDRKWNDGAETGFFVDVVNVSLTVFGGHCGLFRTATVIVVINGAHGLSEASTYTALECSWSPALHPDCNCTDDLLNYHNHAGLCSPTCIAAPFRHVVTGHSGDVWTLRVSTRGTNTSLVGQGRVLYGYVPPQVQSFCLVTGDVFSMSPGPRRDAPYAPSDVSRCQVVLLELTVSRGGASSGSGTRNLTLPVRSLRPKDGTAPEGAEAPVSLHICGADEDTLRTIVSRGWGGQVGVKARFLPRRGTSDRSAPRQEELAALLEWLASFDSRNDRAVRTVVVDVDPADAKLSDFSWTVQVYGSRFELMPGLSAGGVAQLMVPGNHSAFECSHDQRECLGLVTVVGRNGEPLCARKPNSPVPACDPFFRGDPKRCVVCHDARLTVICPQHVWPDRFINSYSGVMVFRPVNSKRSAYKDDALRALGSLVSRHGAFLNVDTVSEFSEERAGCGEVTPARWVSGDYALGEPFTLRLPSHERYPERMGLLVFEELCSRSNNRAGIVVSVPSSAYRQSPACGRVALLNRHDAEDAHRYSLSALSSILSDMAKWGVRRYSLGYLEHTYSRSAQAPFLSELSLRLLAVASTELTLHYSYTRDPTYGDGAYSYAHVQGVYKLEGGLFFQRADRATRGSRGFVLVPGVPGLSLGLSSDMNVGAPLEMREGPVRNVAAEVESVPRGVWPVDLNYRGKVAYVDPVRDRICVHTPHRKPVGPSPELPVPRVRPKESDVPGGGGCLVGTSRAALRARIAVRFLGLPDASVEPLVRALPKLWPRFPAHPLTGEEARWLTREATETDRPAGPRRGNYTLRHVYEKLVACVLASVAGSSQACGELGMYSRDGWPPGGAGYALAGVANESERGLSVKLIVHADYGVTLVRVPCALEPFTFGSGEARWPEPWPGLFTDRSREPLSDTKDELTGAVLWLAERLGKPASLLLCGPAGNDRATWSEEFLVRSEECGDALRKTADDITRPLSELSSAIGKNRRAEYAWSQRVARVTARTYALCMNALLLSVLSSVLWLAVFCRPRGTISCGLSNRYGKLN